MCDRGVLAGGRGRWAHPRMFPGRLRSQRGSLAEAQVSKAVECQPERTVPTPGSQATPVSVH